MRTDDIEQLKYFLTKLDENYMQIMNEKWVDNGDNYSNEWEIRVI